MGLIQGTTDWKAVADADIVIEAVFEEMPIKKEVFAKLDAIAKPDAVLATNTSTLDVDEIASATKRPESVIGTHFFSPANVMRLLENVRGAKSSKTTIATAMAVGRRIGKVPVLVGVCYGFVGNRMLHQRGLQAEKLILEGALPHQVDKVLTDFGFPMGPVRHGRPRRPRRRLAHPEGARRASRRWPTASASSGASARRRAPATSATRRATARRSPIRRSRRSSSTWRPSRASRAAQIADEEILQRLLYPMVNEGAKILEEKIAIRASDIDVIWVYGYGWPVYRGGPMFWADSIGLKARARPDAGVQEAAATRSGRRRRCSTASPTRARGSWDSSGLTGVSPKSAAPCAGRRAAAAYGLLSITSFAHSSATLPSASVSPGIFAQPCFLT